MAAGSYVRRVARVLLGRPPREAVRIEHGRVADNQLLAGRTALITGAGRNIGRAVALEMAQQGATVWFTDRDAESVTRLQAELAASGAKTRGIVSDIADPSAVERLCVALGDEGVVVDVLVNNVGIRFAGAFQTLTMNELRTVFETNVVGPLQLTQHVARTLIAAGRPGTLLFVTSVHQQSTIGDVAYGASKAALAAVVRELAFELAPHRIRVNGIAPGAVSSDEKELLRPFSGAPLIGSQIHPNYIGRAAVYLAADYFSQFTTGSILTVDAGLLARPQNR